MPRIKKTSTAETGVVAPETNDTPNVTPEPTESKAPEGGSVGQPAALATRDSAPRAFGQIFSPENPCELIVEDERGAYVLTLGSHEAAIKALKNVAARLRTYARAGGVHPIHGIHVTGAVYMHVPNGEAVTAEALLVIRTASRDIELPMTSLDRAAKAAEQCALHMTTGRVFELPLENGLHAIVRALSVSVREV